MTDQARELDDLLDRLSYEITAARTAGVADPETLRATLRRIGKLVADADALAVTVLAKRKPEGG